MGKGNRVRVERADERKAKKEAAVKKAKREQRNRTLTTCVAVILAIAIVVTVAYTAFFEDFIASKRLHAGVPLKSENHSITSAQMSYFFNYNYMSVVPYASYFGLDTTKPLSQQDYTMGGQTDYSWYEYLLDTTKTSVTELLVLAEEATARGITLEEAELATVEESLESMKADAESASMDFDEYLTTYYGEHVTEADVRGCIELQNLASKAATVVRAEPTYTEEQITAEVEKNLSKYYYTDYKSIEIKAEYEDGADDATKTQAKADAKAIAESILAAATDEAAFDKAVEDYYRSIHEIVADDAEKTEDEKSDDANTMTETELAEAVAATLTEGKAYSVSDDLGKWAFEQDESEAYIRKAGDTSLITNDDAGTYTVYYMVKPMYRHDYATKNVRHILISLDSADEEHGLPKEDAKAKAESLLASFKAGDATEDEFAALATANTHDHGSQSTGGLYENVNKGDMVEPFENWIYDEARVAGDTGVVESEYGYHVMYFVGDGVIAWSYEAEENMRTDAYNAAVEEFTKNYAVTVDDAAAKLVKQAPMQ